MNRTAKTAILEKRTCIVPSTEVSTVSKSRGKRALKSDRVSVVAITSPDRWNVIEYSSSE